MNIMILDKNFNVIKMVDVYKSFLWNVRFYECGDFELYIPMDDKLLEYYQKGFYICKSDSDRLMIIESLSIETDSEDGDFLIVSGRSLESILGKRIVLSKKQFLRDDETGDKPNLQESIKVLLDENIGEKATVTRILPNFIFEVSDDVNVTKHTFEAEYWGEDLYTIVSKLCKEKEIGFEITYHQTYNGVNNAFVFKLKAGTNRSYYEDDGTDQTDNPYVIFSHKYENLFGSNYVDSDQKLKNVAWVAGETEYDENGAVIQTILTEVGNAYTGLDRREVFVDATSVKMEDENGNVLKADRYEAILQQKGIDKLIDNTPAAVFDAEIDVNSMYVYDRDYTIGDVVQVVNEYGIEGRARITEYIFSKNESGVSAYPTFSMIQKGVYE